MKHLLFLTRYLKFRLNAKTRYRIHSQFIFDFINNILKDKEEYNDYGTLWKFRNQLASSNDPVETVDFGVGAGKKAYKTKILTLGKIVRSRSHSESRLKLLYRITKYYKFQSILEFGTAAGISAAYIKSGNPQSKMVTMEGCANLASHANEFFFKLGLEKIEIAVGNFDVVLDDALKKFNSLDFVFLMEITVKSQH